mmetsp:Transcript_9006/g.37873  ORF Transcript_9006/g.37873 Transcript_9006/m.37873 type:complete len:207 (+) Transcript_9006:882-1502(+)
MRCCLARDARAALRRLSRRRVAFHRAKPPREDVCSRFAKTFICTRTATTPTFSARRPVCLRTCASGTSPRREPRSRRRRQALHEKQKTTQTVSRRRRRRRSSRSSSCVASSPRTSVCTRPSTTHFAASRRGGRWRAWSCTPATCATQRTRRMSWSTRGRTTSCGTPRRRNSRRWVRCTVSCACTGQRRFWSGQRAVRTRRLTSRCV